MRISTPAHLPERPVRGRANLPRLRRLANDAIAASSPPELADLPADTWQAAELVPPVLKSPRALRLDAHVLAWFRAHGPRTESRMRATMRAFMKRNWRRES